MLEAAIKSNLDASIAIAREDIDQEADLNMLSFNCCLGCCFGKLVIVDIKTVSIRHFDLAIDIRALAYLRTKMKLRHHHSKVHS